MNLDLEKPFQETHPIVFRMSAQVVRIDEGLKPSNLYQLTLRKEFFMYSPDNPRQKDKNNPSS